MTPTEAMRRSLDGLSVGDAFGEQFSGVGMMRVQARKLAAPPWRTTDDTEMACAIVAVLAERGSIDADELARCFAERWKREPHRGYGGGAIKILRAIGEGGDWRVAAGEAFRGNGSMGNGGAMRAAPLGAFFADDVPRLIREARASAEVTHAHADGQAGAIAVALAAGWAASSAGALFDFVLDEMPDDGPTRAGIERARAVPHLAPWEAARELGNGSAVLASDTVPFCLWIASRYSHDYQAALWQTAEQFGDSDTNCAIVGGIVALRSSVPPEWLAAREPLHF